MSEYLRKDDVMKVLADMHERMAGLPAPGVKSETKSIFAVLTSRIDRLSTIVHEEKMLCEVKEIAVGNAFRTGAYEYIMISAAAPLGMRACIRVPECDLCFFDEDRQVELMSIIYEVRPWNKEKWADG